MASMALTCWKSNIRCICRYILWFSFSFSVDFGYILVAWTLGSWQNQGFQIGKGNLWEIWS